MKPILEFHHVAKKFCRQLKASLWYGCLDICADLLARSREKQAIRSHEFWAIQDLSFQIYPGESVALIGYNGAGKSTTLKLMNGLFPPDRGKIHLRGKVGGLLELGTGFKEILTGRENIYVNAAILGMPQNEVDKKLGEIISFAEIDDFLEAPLFTYSTGMKVRLGFAIAMHLHPRILLVDEVLSVSDTRFRLKCLNYLKALNRAGTTIVIVSHSWEILSKVARRAIVLNHGKLVFDGTLSQGKEFYNRRQAVTRDYPPLMPSIENSIGKENPYNVPNQEYPI